MIDNKTVLSRKKLFNETGDIEVHLRKMIGGNTTNLNDFNNMKYTWASEWYRQAMNNFWIPEEINMNTDVQDYRKLNSVFPYFFGQHPDGKPAERRAVYHGE